MYTRFVWQCVLPSFLCYDWQNMLPCLLHMYHSSSMKLKHRHSCCTHSVHFIVQNGKFPWGNLGHSDHPQRNVNFLTGKLDHSNFPRGKLDHFKFPCMKSESLTFQEEISVTLSFPEETGVTLPSLRLVWEIWGTLTFQTHTQKNQSLSFRHSLRKFGCLHFYQQSGSLLAYPMKIGESWLSNGKFRSLWLSQKAAGSLQSFRKKLEWPCS